MTELAKAYQHSGRFESSIPVFEEQLALTNLVSAQSHILSKRLKVAAH